MIDYSGHYLTTLLCPRCKRATTCHWTLQIEPYQHYVHFYQCQNYDECGGCWAAQDMGMQLAYDPWTDVVADD